MRGLRHSLMNNWGETTASCNFALKAQQWDQALHASNGAIVSFDPIVCVAQQRQHIPIKVHKPACRPVWKTLGEINSLEIVESASCF
jgi:hypothetical protein